MATKVCVATLMMVSLLSAAAHAGIEPSPFKRRELAQAVERVAVQLDVVATWRGVAPEVVKQTAALRTRLTLLQETIRDTPHLRLVGNVLGIMDAISAVMFNSQPEAVVLQSTMDVLDRLSRVAFNPQPEPPGNTLRAIGIMDRISAVAFNPQPEPPGRATGIAILDKISAVAFNPQPEPPGVVGRVLDVLDAASAVMFNPQPEPPGHDTVAAMLDAIALMGSLQLR
jgi:hypothetical protein